MGLACVWFSWWLLMMDASWSFDLGGCVPVNSSILLSHVHLLAVSYYLLLFLLVDDFIGLSCFVLVYCALVLERL